MASSLVGMASVLFGSSQRAGSPSRTILCADAGTHGYDLAARIDDVCRAFVRAGLVMRLHY